MEPSPAIVEWFASGNKRSVLMYGPPKDSNLRYLTLFYEEKEEKFHIKTVSVNEKISSYEVFYPSGNIERRVTHDTHGFGCRFQTYFYDVKEEIVHKKIVFANKKASSLEIFYPSGNIRSRLTYDTDGSCY